MRHGDYTLLAEAYSRNRAGYSPAVLAALAGVLGRPMSQVRCVDLGAGTGIWTRQVAALHPASLVAVEPNPQMRRAGRRDCAHLEIRWVDARAERTGLADSSCCWVTIASALHWTELSAALDEVGRLLEGGGWFSALWNTRLLEVSPLLLGIEQTLEELCDGRPRVSSGRGGVTEGLTQTLWSTPWVEDVVTVEGRHVEVMTKERYLGLWRSVNDVQVQLGARRFERFMDLVAARLEDVAQVEATYLTRAWSARRRP